MPNELIAITPGDPDGIGPEVTAKAIRGHFPTGDHRLVCIGAREGFERIGASIREVPIESVRRGELPEAEEGRIPLVAAPSGAAEGDLLPGWQAGWSIETAARLALKGKVRALVTGPISKERLQKGGYPWNGHTDFLAELCRPSEGPEPVEVTMMLANDALRVTLVTTHLPLSSVPEAVTRRAVRRAIRQTIEHLVKWWGISKPRIGVAALNPHAGEGGLFGNEEILTIEPAIRDERQMWMDVATISEPLPADTLFAKLRFGNPPERFDAVVCMYHDQGLIPVKQLDFPNTVNVTLGLPIVRTSVDHGTGFDIAGKGIADESSMLAAVRLADTIATRLKRSEP